MQRYNIFNNIHKALRAMLFDTSLCLQQADFCNEDEAEQALDKLSSTLTIFDSHAHSEDNFVLPAIAKFEPSVVSIFEEEHVTDLALGEKLKREIDSFENLRSNDERRITGSILTTAFNEFLVFNMVHMAKEEKILNELLWRNYSDKEIHVIECRIVENISPELIKISALWMIKGMNTVELTAWMKSVAKTAPLPVFESLLGIAENELPEPRYRKLVASLSEAVMIA